MCTGFFRLNINISVVLHWVPYKFPVASSLIFSLIFLFGSACFFPSISFLSVDLFWFGPFLLWQIIFIAELIPVLLLLNIFWFFNKVNVTRPSFNLYKFCYFSNLFLLQKNWAFLKILQGGKWSNKKIVNVWLAFNWSKTHYYWISTSKTLRQTLYL